MRLPHRKLWARAIWLGMVGSSLLVSGCGLLKSAESSGCSDTAEDLAVEMARDYRADGEPFCEYGTTWLVLADSGHTTFTRVLSELRDDGWELESGTRANPDGGSMFLPGVSVGSEEEGWRPYIVFDPSSARIELNAGSGDA